MTKKVSCPSCNDKIPLSVSDASMVCPSCGRRLRIVREGDAADPVPALAFPEPPSPEDESTVLVPSGRPVVLWVVVGVVLSVAAVVVWGWLLC